MKRICLQAGHENTQYNSILNLRRSSGAPGEMSFNVDIRNKVADELRKRGFDVATTDANANDDKNITGQDWDMFLAIHYDADIYSRGGGFVDFPDSSVDQASSESQRLARELTNAYFPTTKIANINRSNDNTKLYYMWHYLTAKTPCVLIECGVGMHVPDDWQTLHFNRPIVVEGIIRGICAAFGIAYQVEPPTIENDLSKQNAILVEANTALTLDNQKLRGDMDSFKKTHQTDINNIKVAAKNLQNKVEEFIAFINQF